MAEPVRVIDIVDVIAETPDAVSLVLALPEAWSYRPGQFLTVRAGNCARHYSFSSSPYTGERPQITVKRVADGMGSNWICDNVTPGFTLECLPPGGTFVPASLDRDLLLLAGGSGITPMMSILKSALARGTGRVALVYANRDPESVIFAGELARLQGGRLTVRHWLDSENGPPTAEGLRGLIEPFMGYEAFVCGPEPFMRLARDLLGGAIHMERFESLAENPFESPVSQRAATLRVHIDGQDLTLPWPVRSRLLDVLLDKGLNPPFSCRQGTCGACATRMLHGDVELVNNEILEEEDFAEGYILACQALPLTDEVHVDYT
jgi:3-ketosteroid 9alpha-monooxygenase subunit B